MHDGGESETEANWPVTISEISFMELSDKLFKFIFNLESIDLLIICLILWSEVIAEEDASIVKSSHRHF